MFMAVLPLPDFLYSDHKTDIAAMTTATFLTDFLAAIVTRGSANSRRKRCDVERIPPAPDKDRHPRVERNCVHP